MPIVFSPGTFLQPEFCGPSLLVRSGIRLGIGIDIGEREAGPASCPGYRLEFPAYPVEVYLASPKSHWAQSIPASTCPPVRHSNRPCRPVAGHGATQP